MLNQNINSKYDSHNDVLYLSIGAPTPSYGDDLFDGIIARYDMLTDELTGITILGFKNRVVNSDPQLHELPIKFDFDTIACV